MTADEVRLVSALAIKTRDHGGRCVCRSCNRLADILVRCDASVDRNGSVTTRESIDGLLTLLVDPIGR